MLEVVLNDWVIDTNVTVEDDKGRRAVDEYSGISGRRVLALDGRGRLRPK
jgi:hypothetical protein